MALFKKKNESFSQPAENKFLVIKHDFLNDEIAYKYPEENFYPHTILFVKPGQEAIFVKEGHAETFTAGRYELITDNFPNMKKFVNKTYNNQEIFNCYVYFINKEKPIKCYWGTPEPIFIESEKYYGSTFRVTGNGEYTLTIDNCFRLLSKTIGQLDYYDAETIDEFIFGEIIQRIIAIIGKAVQKENILFSQLSSHIFEISKEIKEQLILDRVFEELGFKLNTFSVSSLKLHDEDYKKVQEMDRTWREGRMQSELEKRRLADEGFGKAEAMRSEGFVEAEIIRAKGLAEAEVMHQKGSYYAQERAYDVLQAAAGNEGAGQVGGINPMTTGMSIGMGVGLGQGFGQAMGQVSTNSFNQGAINPINNQNTVQNTNGVSCPSCGKVNSSTAKFCDNCGQKIPTQSYCSNCGVLLNPNVKFCSNCGTKCEN